MWVRNYGRAWLGSSFTLGRVDGGFSVILSWLKGWSRRPKTALLACLGDWGGLKIRTAKQSTYAWLLHVLGVLTAWRPQGCWAFSKQECSREQEGNCMIFYDPLSKDS